MHYRKLAIVPPAAAVLLVLTMTSPAAAAQTFALGTTPSVTDCAGGTTITAVSKKTLPEGSTAYVYTLPGGQTFEQVVPPVGFDPDTASPGLLKEVGLPERPTATKSLADWKDEVAPFVTNGIDGAPFCLAADASVAPDLAPSGPQPMSSVGHTGHTFWSGYEIRSGAYQKAVGHFTQPLVFDTTNSAMSNWVGLNGTGSGGRLIQAGTVNDVSSPDYGTPSWELFCSGGSAVGCIPNWVELPAHKANPGDDVSISVSYNPATLLSYYHVAINGTLRVNIQYQMQNGSNSGNVADFITERFLSPLRNIPDFGSLSFTSSRTYPCWDGSCLYEYIGGQNFFAYEMTNNGSFVAASCGTPHLLVYPAGISGGSFTNQFCSKS